MKYIITILIMCAFAGCDEKKKTPEENAAEVHQLETVKAAADTPIINVHRQPETLAPSHTINTRDISPVEVLSFARTQQGVPYLFASTDPEKGFDCSGFITYIFNHFNIKVPRSSVDFTNLGNEVDLDHAEPGDLILFTGTDSSTRIVGHMGMIESRKNDSLYFIHSSSGKANGVVITPVSKYYLGRFIKVIRVFPDRYFVNIE